MSSNDVLAAMLSNQKEQLDRIERQAIATNGRVKNLELWQAKMLGAAISVKWVPPVVSAVAAALLVSLFQ